VFVGRNSGELEAYNAETGQRLWSFQTGAGANDTATFFEQDDLTAIPAAENRAAVLRQVTNGGGGMPASKGQLTPKQIHDVTAYVTQRIANE
jgi:mono/diheme cytochrome c family protein